MPEQKLTTTRAHHAAQSGEITADNRPVPWHRHDWQPLDVPAPTLEKIPVFAEGVGDLPEVARTNPIPHSRNTDALWAPLLHYAPPRLTCPDCGRNDTWFPLAIVTIDVEAVCLCQSGLTTVTTRARLKGGVVRGDAEWEIVREGETP